MAAPLSVVRRFLLIFPGWIRKNWKALVPVNVAKWGLCFCALILAGVSFSLLKGCEECDEDSVLIGHIPNNELRTFSHVLSLLEKEGIPTDIHGSRVYGISVSAKHADKALEILRGDSEAHQCSITVYDSPYDPYGR